MKDIYLYVIISINLLINAYDILCSKIKLFQIFF